MNEFKTINLNLEACTSSKNQLGIRIFNLIISHGKINETPMSLFEIGSLKLPKTNNQLRLFMEFAINFKDLIRDSLFINLNRHMDNLNAANEEFRNDFYILRDAISDLLILNSAPNEANNSSNQYILSNRVTSRGIFFY